MREARMNLILVDGVHVMSHAKLELYSSMLTSVLGRAIGRGATNHIGAPRLYSSILFIASPHVRFSFDFGAKAGGFITSSTGGVCRLT